MSGVGAHLGQAVAFWLGIGLLVDAMLAVRQWRYLARHAAGEGSAGATDMQRGYGQWRAVFGWLARAEGVLRLGVWVPTGGLLALHADLATLGPAGSVVLFASFAAADRLLRQPLVWARWRFVECRFGMSRMPRAGLLRDAARHVAVDAGLAALAAPWLLWPFRLWPHPVAWMVSATLGVLGMGIMSWARPNVIAPLFNRFEPLPDGELRGRLQAMMQRCDTHLDAVLVMDHSRRSNLANAYFTGVGRSKRIVLFDTLIKRLEAVELEAVMAHELGHYRCGHLRRYYGLLGGLILLAFGVAGIGHDMLGMPAPPAVVILSLYLVLPTIAWPLAPWLAFLRRRYEYEADAFAARHASRAGLIRALEKLLAHNLNSATMDPWYAAFYATHPPGQERLARLQMNRSVIL